MRDYLIECAERCYAEKMWWGSVHVMPSPVVFEKVNNVFVEDDFEVRECTAIDHTDPTNVWFLLIAAEVLNDRN